MISRVSLPITVVIRASDHDRSLRNALRSVDSQTLAPAEVLVLDGLFDETHTLARTHRATVVACDPGNPARARASGIAAASQPWIAFLEGDTVWEPRKLERQWDAVQALPDVGLVFTDHLSMGDPEAPPRLVESAVYRRIARPTGARGISAVAGEELAPVWVDGQAFVLSSVLVRRALCANIPACEVTLRGIEESEFLFPIVAATRLAAVEEPLTHLIVGGNCAAVSYRLAVDTIEAAERVNQTPSAYPSRLLCRLRRLKTRRAITAARELLRAGDAATAAALLRRSHATRTAVGAGLAVIARFAATRNGRAVLARLVHAVRRVRPHDEMPVIVHSEPAIEVAQRRRLVALTFDDGPDPVVTPLLLKQLVGLGVTATFFPIGVEAHENASACRALAAAGMELGNHSLTHSRLTTLDSAGQMREIAEGARAIAQASGAPVRWFRPPYGAYDATTLAACAAARQTMALWNVDSHDWSEPDEEMLVRVIASEPRAPAIVLLHASLLTTAAALPGIVGFYRANGYTFVTLSELAQRLALAEINAAPHVAVTVPAEPVRVRRIRSSDMPFPTPQQDRGRATSR